MYVYMFLSLRLSFVSLTLSLCVCESLSHTEVSSVSSWIFLSQVLCTELATTCCPFNCRTRGAERRVQCARKACKQEELVVKGKNEEAQRWRQAAAAAETKQPSVLHTVYVCVNASVLVSLPRSVSFGRNKKNYSDRRAVSWMDENITLTKSSGLMKALL